MLIFDSFPSEESANLFAHEITRDFGLDAGLGRVEGARIFSKALSADPALECEVDFFPFPLVPPVVVVERPEPSDAAIESAIIDRVEKFGGEFSGT